MPDAPGVFGRVRYGDVDIFLLDDRWYRSANDALDGPDKTMFGAAQLAWLRDALIYSHAPVKLVVNGSQMWNRVNRFEGWNRYRASSRRSANGCWRSASRDCCSCPATAISRELLKVERAGAYPMYEFTSSPLTSGRG